LFDTPPLFAMIQEQSESSWEEMYKVFNMGSLLEFYTDENTAVQLITIAAEYGIDARIIGHVEASDNDGEVLLSTLKGDFTYYK